MRCGDSVGGRGPSGCVHAVAVAEPGDHPGLVLGQPEADPIPEPAPHHLGVLAECIDGTPLGPPTRVLERNREIPVVERHERLDLVREQLVDHAVVEVETRLVHPSPAVGEDARPGDGETECRRPELADQGDVLAVAVIEVAGHRAVLAVPDLAGRGAEAIPDALAAPVEIPRTFDLVGRGSRSPDEARREGGAWGESLPGHFLTV